MSLLTERNPVTEIPNTIKAIGESSLSPPPAALPQQSRVVLGSESVPPALAGGSTVLIEIDSNIASSTHPLSQVVLNLTDLNPESARRLLRSNLPEAKAEELSDSDIDDVIALSGRNPMCLKLAARLLEDEGVEKLRSERSEVFTKLKAEKIQALLYGRILRHVHDDEVRKVAYPGI